jgi:hypothetical protein
MREQYGKEAKKEKADVYYRRDHDSNRLWSAGFLRLS